MTFQGKLYQLMYGGHFSGSKTLSKEWLLYLELKTATSNLQLMYLEVKISYKICSNGVFNGK